MTTWRIGTMGFSYADWAGAFYPEGTPPLDYLEFYAKHFDSVELDTTFHAVPPVDRVQSWAAVTPPDFCFATKAPKAVTHEPHGSIDRAIAPMIEYLDVMRHLGAKLGPVLLQFPPSFTVRYTPALVRFLRELPPDLRYAIEFRNETWFVDSTIGLLREHGCCWVAADYANEPRQLHVTSDFLYIRWIGQHRQFPSMDRERIEVTDRLAVWKRHIEAVLPNVSAVWGFFNNDYAGHAPATARRWLAMVGLPVPEVQRDRQGKLFE